MSAIEIGTSRLSDLRQSDDRLRFVSAKTLRQVATAMARPHATIASIADGWGIANGSFP
jgi:hypothetical protein